MKFPKGAQQTARGKKEKRKEGLCLNLIQKHSCSKNSPAACLIASVLILDNLHIPQKLKNQEKKRPHLKRNEKRPEQKNHRDQTEHLKKKKKTAARCSVTLAHFLERILTYIYPNACVLGRIKAWQKPPVTLCKGLDLNSRRTNVIVCDGCKQLSA